MRFGLLLFCLSIFGLEVSPGALAAAPPLYEQSTLANGLELVSLESHKVPLVTIVLCAKAGAMTETKDLNGLTHLWEHMFFKGNQRLKDQEAFNQRIRELGIVYNGDTSAEQVRYYFTLPSAHLEAGLQFMADAIMSPLLEKSELERERQVVLNEWDRNASSPGFDLWRLRRRLLYGEESFRRDALGDRATVENASREQLLRIKAEVFVPANMALLVAGDFVPSRLRELVAQQFGSWTSPANWRPLKIPSFPAFPAVTQPKEVVMAKEDARNINYSLSWNGPRARLEPEDSYAADILINLLGHRSGKFYQKYVDSGLTLQSGLSYHTQSQAGELMLFLAATPSQFAKAKELIAKEPAEWLKEDYFSAEQLEDVRRSLKIGYQFEVNKPSDFIKTLAFWWAVTGLDYHKTYLDKMAAVDLKAVRAFVQKYFIDKPVLASVLLSTEDAAALKLKDNAAPLVAEYFPSPQPQKKD